MPDPGASCPEGIRFDAPSFSARFLGMIPTPPRLLRPPEFRSNPRERPSPTNDIAYEIVRRHVHEGSLRFGSSRAAKNLAGTRSCIQCPRLPQVHPELLRLRILRGNRQTGSSGLNGIHVSRRPADRISRPTSLTTSPSSILRADQVRSVQRAISGVPENCVRQPNTERP